MQRRHYLQIMAAISFASAILNEDAMTQSAGDNPLVANNRFLTV